MHAGLPLGFFLCGRLYVRVYVCVYVCVSAPEANKGMMWHDMDLIRLIKQVLQLLYGNCSHYR